MGAWLEFRPRRRILNQLLRARDEGRRPGDVVAVAHHPVAYTPAATWGLAALLLWWALFWIDAPGELGFLVLLVAARGAWLALKVYQDRFVVTNVRIFRIQGVLNQHLAAMPLARIVDVTLEEPFWGRFAGRRNYGHLIFENAAQDQGLREIRFIPDPDLIIDLIQDRAFPSPPGGGRGGGDAAGATTHDPTRPTGVVTRSDDSDKTGEIPRVT